MITIIRIISIINETENTFLTEFSSETLAADVKELKGSRSATSSVYFPNHSPVQNYPQVSKAKTQVCRLKALQPYFVARCRGTTPTLSVKTLRSKRINNERY